MRLVCKYRNQVHILIEIMIACTLSGCDDVISVDTGSASQILNIDAWVNNKSQTQTISLTLTQDYFDNSDLPPAASGASVTITDNNGTVFTFQEDTVANDGSYRWKPVSEEILGETGNTYTLKVIYKGETFAASCITGRVPQIDSITFAEQENAPDNGKYYYQAEFWAKDLTGKGDTYWIRTYKNGELLNKASELTIAYDAASTSGTDFDGVTFLSPVRKGINAKDEDDDGQPLPALLTSDSIYVEIHSLTDAAFNYINEVKTQTDKQGGLAELFTSTPLANVSTNITNTSGKSSSVVGFFNVAVVSGKGKKFIKP